MPFQGLDSITCRFQVNLKTKEYIVDPIYDEIEYQPGDMFALTFEYEPSYNQGAVNIVTGQVILECNNAYVSEEYGYIIYVNKEYNMGVVDYDGQTILPAIYKQIHASSEGEFFIIDDNGQACVINSEGIVQKKFENLYLVDYFGSVNVWSFEYADLAPQETDFRISGFMDASFNLIIDHEYYDFGLTIGKYLYTPFNSKAPVPVVEDNPLGEYRFVNSSGYADGCYTKFAWIKEQGVLVVEDNSGKCGLLSYDGTVLFGLQECHILINPQDETLISTNWNASNLNNSYNTTKYLIYTVSANES